MEDEIIDYIKKARGHGLSDLEIKQNLLSAGWEAEIIEDNFSHAKSLESRETPFKPREDMHIPGHFGQPIRPSEVLNTNHSNFPNPASGLAETSFAENANGTPAYKKPAIWLGAILALGIFFGAGYWYLAYGFNTPGSIWQKFSKLSQSKIYKSTFNFNYSDKGEFSAKDFDTFKIKDLDLSLSGNTYIDIRDEKNPKSSAEVQYAFGSGNTKISTGFKYRILDRMLYFNIGENPFLNNLFGSAGENAGAEWLKIDLNALEDELGTGSAGEKSELEKIFSENFRNEIGKIWEDAVFVKVEKYLGREKINGENTVHFKNTLDKQAIKNALNAIADKTIAAINAEQPAASGGQISQEQLSAAHSAINLLTDRLEVKTFETWVGVKDFRLYKVKYEGNAPSIISFLNLVVNEGLSTARQKSRDAKRLADIRQLASALELYYGDKGAYPENHDGLRGGLAPVYIGIVPAAPTPPDGSCTDQYNAYRYEPKGKIKKDSDGNTGYENYELTFCLGYDVGGYPGGIARLTPEGIQGNIACPAGQEKCYADTPSPKEDEKNPSESAEEMINKLDYSASIKLEAGYSDYGQSQEIQVPDNSMDLLKAFKGEVQGLFTKQTGN